MIDAEITIRTAAGTRTGHYRLLTTLTDPSTHPAGEPVQLYHERRESETAYLELKSTLLDGRVLRARTPDGMEQEVWALLVAYQAPRTAMSDATDSIPGTDPDRAGFLTALAAARDQIILAAGIHAGIVIDLVGTIGRHVLAHLLPARRTRTKDRIVKRAISKYTARGPAIDRTTYKATISINLPMTTPTPPQLNDVGPSPRSWPDALLRRRPRRHPRNIRERPGTGLPLRRVGILHEVSMESARRRAGRQRRARRHRPLRPDIYGCRAHWVTHVGPDGLHHPRNATLCDICDNPGSRCACPRIVDLARFAPARRGRPCGADCPRAAARAQPAGLTGNQRLIIWLYSVTRPTVRERRRRQGRTLPRSAPPPVRPPAPARVHRRCRVDALATPWREDTPA
ncbi:hypothetical protein [Streptomyces sp. NPDC086777]|uniref:hypothetical protein n=1 Tax=Streptomyces sp. NPDC086777 TaxID=3154866 RepID=UPI00344CA3CE